MEGAKKINELQDTYMDGYKDKLPDKSIGS